MLMNISTVEFQAFIRMCMIIVTSCSTFIIQTYVTFLFFFKSILIAFVADSSFHGLGLEFSIIFFNVTVPFKHIYFTKQLFKG